MTKQNKTALQKATDLLARQDQSSTVLRRKLLIRKYDASEVDAAIDKLKQANYLDDDETCRRQFENLYEEGKLSLRQILYKLMQRGFDKSFIEQLIPDDADEHERLAAARLLEKKFKRTDDKTFKAKAWQFLAARGFGEEVISAAIEDFLRKE